jgi:hypothetical protein
MCHSHAKKGVYASACMCHKERPNLREAWMHLRHAPSPANVHYCNEVPLCEVHYYHVPNKISSLTRLPHFCFCRARSRRVGLRFWFEIWGEIDLARAAPPTRKRTLSCCLTFASRSSESKVSLWWLGAGLGPKNNYSDTFFKLLCVWRFRSALEAKKTTSDNWHLIEVNKTYTQANILIQIYCVSAETRANKNVLWLNVILSTKKRVLFWFWTIFKHVFVILLHLMKKRANTVANFTYSM